MSKQTQKRILREILTYLCPFIFSLTSSLLIFLLFGILLKGVGVGGAAIGSGFFAVLFFVVLPVYAATYSGQLLYGRRYKYLLALYNSFVITMFYLLPHCTLSKTYIYSAIIFAWIALWGILPLLPFKKFKKKKADSADEKRAD